MPSAVEAVSSGHPGTDRHRHQEEKMDPRLIELDLHLRHRHSDGTWSPLTEVSPSHDPAASDPERSWGFGRLFRCSTCGEEVVVEPEDEPTGPAGRG
jgi:hypothetical protein